MFTTQMAFGQFKTTPVWDLAKDAGPQSAAFKAQGKLPLSAAAGFDIPCEVIQDSGAHTVTFSQGSTTFKGRLVGSGTITTYGGGVWSLTGDTAGFSGKMVAYNASVSSSGALDSGVSVA